MDIFEGRTLLLSLSELGGPGLESGFFVTSDSPGLLALFWGFSVHLPNSLCSFGGAILVTSSYTQTLMANICSSAAPLIWRPVPALLPPASEDHPTFRVEVSDATASVSGLLLTMGGTQV